MLVSGVLLMCASCKSSDKTAGGNNNHSVVDLGPVVNNDYKLQNDTILVQGIGQSSLHQMAHDKARLKALSNACDSVHILVNEILLTRGFLPDTASHYVIDKYKTVARRTTTFNNEKGKRMYKSYCTFAIPVEPILKSVFERMSLDDSYGYCQFLRDYDRIINSKK